MNHTMTSNYYVRLLSILPHADLDADQPNPALTFNKIKGAGAFDHYTEAEYESALGATNELAKLWDGQRSITTGELIGRSFEAANLSALQLRDFASVLASAYEKAGHTEGLDRPYVELGYQLPARAPRRASSSHFEVSEDVLALSPRRIFDVLGSTVWGQDEAKEAMALLLWHHMRGNARSILVAGPTGCGKSLLVEAARGVFDNVVEIDGSQISAEGWRGEVKFTNLFRGMKKQMAEHAIVVIDEADKLFEPKTSSGGENVSYQLQNELLKLMDGGHTKTLLGTKKDSPYEKISTEHISFVFLGSFESMLKAKASMPNGMGFGGTVRSRDQEDYGATFTSEDLVQHAGVRREVAGRIGHIVQMRPLTAADYLSIIDNPMMSPLVKLEGEYGFSLPLTETEKLELAERAVDSKLGVRSIRAQLERRMDAELFEHGTPETPAA